MPSLRTSLPPKPASLIEEAFETIEQSREMIVCFDHKTAGDFGSFLNPFRDHRWGRYTIFGNVNWSALWAVPPVPLSQLPCGGLDHYDQGGNVYEFNSKYTTFYPSGHVSRTSYFNHYVSGVFSGTWRSVTTDNKFLYDNQFLDVSGYKKRPRKSFFATHEQKTYNHYMMKDMVDEAGRARKRTNAGRANRGNDKEILRMFNGSVPETNKTIEKTRIGVMPHVSRKKRAQMVRDSIYANQVFGLNRGYEEEILLTHPSIADSFRNKSGVDSRELGPVVMLDGAETRVYSCDITIANAKLIRDNGASPPLIVFKYNSEAHIVQAKVKEKGKLVTKDVKCDSGGREIWTLDIEGDEPVRKIIKLNIKNPKHRAFLKNIGLERGVVKSSGGWDAKPRPQGLSVKPWTKADDSYVYSR